MSLRDQLADDMNTVFLNTEEFGETITYFPKVGRQRSIVATRATRTRADGSDQHHTMDRDLITLLVRNDATEGMTNPQMGDCIRLAGEHSEERWGFASIDDSDASSFTVTWQKHSLRRMDIFESPDVDARDDTTYGHSALCSDRVRWETSERTHNDGKSTGVFRERIPIVKVSIKVDQVVTVGGVELKAVACGTHNEGNSGPVGVMTFEVADDKASEIVGPTPVVD